MTECFICHNNSFVIAAGIIYYVSKNLMELVDSRTRKEITDTLMTILETWSRHSDTHVEDMSAFFDEGFSGFGTEAGEIWRSKQDMVEQQIRDHEQTPGGFSYEIRDLKIFPTRDPLINICCFRMDMSFQVGEQSLHLKDYRHSAVFQKRGKNWLSIHWHASKGGKNVDDEVFPGATGPKRYEEVSILFTDFVGFTHAVSSIPADTLVNELNDIFSSFDRIAQKNGVLKVKTIGDAFMGVAGLKEGSDKHARICILTAKEMIEYLNKRNQESALKWELRAGIHSGPVIGGFIGFDETNFDIWGDTVNLASHMEGSGLPGEINISAYTYHLVKNDFPCTYRGKIEAKGKGAIDMYLVDV